MRRYHFHIYAAGVVSRDDVGQKFSSDRSAISYGQRIVDELTKDEDYRDATIDILTSSGRLVARLISREASLFDQTKDSLRRISLH